MLKVGVPVYDGIGPVEDSIRWWGKVMNLIKMRPVETSSAKFNLIPQVLSKEGSAMTFWEEAVKKATQRRLIVG